MGGVMYEINIWKSLYLSDMYIILRLWYTQSYPQTNILSKFVNSGLLKTKDAYKIIQNQHDVSFVQ